MRIHELKNGDLVGWRGRPPGASKFSYINLVRLLTLSDYGHVSIVWRHPEWAVEHVEAVMPTVRRVVLPSTADIYAIPIKKHIPEHVMQDYFGHRIGWEYSLRDAIYGLIGRVPREDDRVQCAEMITDFYSEIGMSFRGNTYTPSRLIRRMLMDHELTMHRLMA